MHHVDFFETSSMREFTIALRETRCDDTTLKRQVEIFSVRIFDIWSFSTKFVRFWSRAYVQLPISNEESSDDDRMDSILNFFELKFLGMVHHFLKMITHVLK